MVEIVVINRTYIIIFFFFFPFFLFSKGFYVTVLNKSGIHIDLGVVAHDDDKKIAEEYVQIDKFGFFWFANEGKKVQSFCISNKNDGDYAEIYWKYMGVLGLKTLEHILYIEPLRGVFVCYIFKDGLIALHDRSKNIWKYQRIPMNITQIPGIKEIITVQTFNKDDFLKELNRVTHMYGETIPDDPFILSDSIEKQIANETCQ